MTSAKRGGDKTRIEVMRSDELAPGRTKKFVFTIDGCDIEAFVLNHRGRLHAYINRCRHVPMGLDWVENQFFTEDAQYVLCATHGACYLPDTGECVDGPPLGQSLVRVPLEIRDGKVFASLPDEEIPRGLRRDA